MAYSFVASHQVNSSNSATTTLAITILAGQSLVLLAADGSNQGATLTATDTLGNVYVSRKTQNDTFNGETYALLDCLAPIAGSTTITLTTTGTVTPQPGLIVLVYTGIGSFDQVVSSFAHSGWATTTNGALSSAISPTSQPAMLLGFASGIGGTIAPDAAANSQVNNTAWVNAQSTVVEDYRKLSTSSTQSAFTFSLATASNAIIAATYIESTNGGAVLAAAATDSTSASGALNTTLAPFAQVLLDNPAHVNGSDQINMGAGPGTGTGDTANAAFLKIKQWAIDINVMMSQIYPVRSVQTPVTGFTIAAAAGLTQLILNPAGTLATGTVTLPKGPQDGQPFALMTTQTITALTANTGDGTTLNGAPTTLAANAGAKWRYAASLNTWIREP